ncbi:hypothetical protein DFH09DRAFT_1302244 [Mycena vulgaris]|nr:hypothetical protein DFH09DRAFT_1302244 [Mycena vulgaris]
MSSFSPLPLPHSCLLLTRAVRPCLRLLDNAAGATSGFRDDARRVQGQMPAKSPVVGNPRERTTWFDSLADSISPAPPRRSPPSARLGLELLAQCQPHSACAPRIPPAICVDVLLVHPASARAAMSPHLSLYEDIISIHPL